MIVFYDKATGEVIGTIEGRVHSEQQLGMWMGDKEAIGKLVVNWKQIPGSNDFEPDAPEMLKKVMILLDKNPGSVFKYKVDTKTGSLVLQ